MAAFRGSLTSQASDFLALYEGKVRACALRLDEEQVWWRPHPQSLSVGNMVLHVCGNLSLWILKTLGERDYERHRSLEFTADHTLGRDALVAQLGRVVDECREVLASVDEAVLDRPFHVQRYDTDGRGIVFHAVEHMAYHTGQVVFVTKQLLGPGHAIEFYPIHKGE